MQQIDHYISQNKERFLEEVFSLLRIPSISAKPEHKEDMKKAAEFWESLMSEAGCDIVEIIPTAGNPVVYGEKIIDKNLPTVLVYGHLDVMPVEPLELWNSLPFDPQIRDGKIFARGSSDDKGQSYMHAKAIEMMLKTNTLPCNVKFIIEGEEEVGSPNLRPFLEQNKELLKADIILVSDSGIIAPETPSITAGIRGLTYMQVEVTGPNRDLHSGLYGGAVANPIMELSKMIAKLTDENGKITITGFYDEVLESTLEERQKMAQAPFDLEKYKSKIGIKDVSGEAGYTTNERTGIRPALDVNGIWGGYIGQGTKTVLPSKAYAKISMRLVPNQNYKKIAELFQAYFTSLAPGTITVKVDYLHGGQGYISPIDIPAYKAAEKAYEEVFGKTPIPVRSGGSIPIIADFEEVLGIKTILMGFGLDEDAIHSPNESFRLELFYKGLATIPRFYKYYAEFMKNQA